MWDKITLTHTNIVGIRIDLCGDTRVHIDHHAAISLQGSIPYPSNDTTNVLQSAVSVRDV